MQGRVMPILKGVSREIAAEFLSTFILIVFGLGVVAQVVLSGESNGNYLSINLAWGLAVAMGTFVGGSVSGAHMNPAVTIALAIHRRFPWKRVPAFCGAQFVGAFLASLVVYFTYREALDHFDGGVRQIMGSQATAGIWATYPQAFLSTFPGGFVDQFVGTALLIVLIFALSDKRNNGGPYTPILVGLGVVLIGMTFGYNAGYAINPARDLGPRLFTALAGWGPGVFSACNHWWWVPVTSPILGAVAGGYVYDFLITRHQREPSIA